jgi:WD40 repeat protein/beta-lactamase regulating signal transducer with metallopeptidase domain
MDRLLAGGPWLGVTLVQVTLVAALGLLAWLVARQRGPALRGAVVLAALVGLLAVPGLAAVAPVWLAVPGLAPSAAAEPPGPAVAVRLPPPPPPEIVVPAVPPMEPSGKLPPGLDDTMDPFDDLDPPTENAELVVAAPLPTVAAAPATGPGEPRRAAPSVASILVTVWLFGALVYLLRALMCLGLLYHWARQAHPIREEEWAWCLKSLPDHEDFPRLVLRESSAVDSPLTLGLFRPVILLPAGWHGWPAGQLRLVLAHELAHIRRGDFLAGLVAEVAVCLCWFHPLVRWLGGRLRLEQEYAADASAASAAGDAMTYVRCLARLALEQGTGRGSPAPAFWRRRPEILRRIDMLRRNRDGLSLRLGRGAAGAVVVLATAACVAVAGVGPLRAIAVAVAEEPAPADTTPTTAPEVKPAAAGADAHGDLLPAGAVARLGTTRWRSGANINYVAFGPDDKTLITAGQDGTVRLWDIATGKEVRRFARPTPAGLRPQPARPAGAPGTQVIQPVPVPAQRLAADAAEVAALRARLEEAAAAKARLEVAEAAAAAAKARLDAAKPGGQADAEAAKRKLDAAKAAEEAAKARAEAARAQLEAQLRGRAGAASDNSATAVTPDGKTVAVAGGNVVQLYEVETGNELRKIQGVPTGLVGLLFSPDGKTLAGRTSDGGAILWNTDTAKERQRIKAPPRPNSPQVQVAAIRAGGDAPGMAFTADSKALVVVSNEFKDQALTSTVKFWDVVSGEEVRDLKGPLGVVSGVAFSPNGKTLVYCAGGVARAFATETGDPLYEIRTNDPAAGVQFSPDGKLLAVRGRNQQVRICDGSNGKELYTVSDPMPVNRGAIGGVVFAGAVNIAPEVRTLAFSADGQRIATASGGTLRLWTAATGKEVPLSDGHNAPLVAVALSPDGKTVVSLGTDRLIRRWEAATGKPLGGFQLASTVAALSPDGKTVAVAGTDGTIRVHETDGGKAVHQFRGYPRGSAALTFSPDGAVLAERGADGTIRLYDPAKGTELRQLTAQGANNPAAPGTVIVATTGRVVGGTSFSGLVFSPDGKLIASSGSSSPAGFGGANVVPPNRGRSNGTINLFDVGTGKILRKIELTLGVASFAFSPDGRVLATENADESVSLWEVASGRERARLGGRAAPPAPAPGATPALVRVVGGIANSAEPAGPITLAFSPDGRVLVVRGSDRSVRFWDVDGGTEVGQFKGHDGRIETVSFSPDGKCVASGSSDTTVLLWDAVAMRKDMPVPQSVELPDGAAESLWADLAAEDASKALKSVLKLAADPRQAVPFLGERLRPAAPIDQQKLEQWIADLESDKFAARQEAITNLVKAGEQVVPALQKMLTTQPTIETRLRVEGLLDKLTGGILSTEQLRLVRSVEALEKMGTPEAKDVLRTLAGGASGALPTREARAALDRMNGR